MPRGLFEVVLEGGGRARPSGKLWSRGGSMLRERDPDRSRRASVASGEGFGLDGSAEIAENIVMPGEEQERREGSAQATRTRRTVGAALVAVVIATGMAVWVTVRRANRELPVLPPLTAASAAATSKTKAPTKVAIPPAGVGRSPTSMPQPPVEPEVIDCEVSDDPYCNHIFPRHEPDPDAIRGEPYEIIPDPNPGRFCEEDVETLLTLCDPSLDCRDVPTEQVEGCHKGCVMQICPNVHDCSKEPDRAWCGSSCGDKHAGLFWRNFWGAWHRCKPPGGWRARPGEPSLSDCVRSDVEQRCPQLAGTDWATQFRALDK